MDETTVQTTPAIPTPTEPTPAPQTEASVPAPSSASGNTAEQADDFIGLTEDGEVKFGKGFFEGLGEEPAAPEVPTGAVAGMQTEAPAVTLYTPEDLRNVSLDQLEEGRLPEAVRPFYPIVRDQLTRVRQYENVLRLKEQQLMAFVQQMQAGQVPAASQQQTAQTTQPAQKDLAAEAMKLASERMGIKETDFDGMDPKHIAALTMASNEVCAKHEREEQTARQQTQVAQQRQAAEADFRNFAVALATQPDYGTFEQWVDAQLKAKGRNTEELEQYVRQTGDYAGVQQLLNTWYRMYRDGKTRPVQPPAPGSKKVVPPVPVVESGNGAQTVNKSIDLKAFREMDSDEQAQALLTAGLV